MKKVLWSLFGGLLVLLMAQSSAWLDSLAPPQAGEGVALRWLRACAQHPVRTGLALSLAAAALAARRPAPSQRWGQELGSGVSPAEPAGSGALPGGIAAGGRGQAAARAPES
jgi:hypothetical protein